MKPGRLAPESVPCRQGSGARELCGISRHFPAVWSWTLWPKPTGLQLLCGQNWDNTSLVSSKLCELYEELTCKALMITLIKFSSRHCLNLNAVIYWLCDFLARDLTSLSLSVSLSVNGIKRPLSQGYCECPLTPEPCGKLSICASVNHA